jgi:hypothetical protein
MIPIPDSSLLLHETKQLIDFFNQLESKLQHPNCQTPADVERVVIQAQHELILWGKVKMC